MSDPGAIPANILGEVLWHTANKDKSILQVSHEHRHQVLGHANRFLAARDKTPIRFLEVAAYAHITGYLLAQRHGWNATVSDISVEMLALGARYARASGIDAGLVRRVAVDFHDLPFPDSAFDIVYICSALHHTLRWQLVLYELLRITAPGGILIMPNEPCRRDFCFYKFPTNRPEAFRPVEAELERLDILRTIAEPFTGSRPETLFGMVENQKMPLPEILQLLGSGGRIEMLSIDSLATMSPLDHAIVAARSAPYEPAALASMVESEITRRLDAARSKLTATDAALGIRFPDQADVATMAAKVARKVSALPLPAALPEKAAPRDRAQALLASAEETLKRAAYCVYRIPSVGPFAVRMLKRLAYAAYRVPPIDALLQKALLRHRAGAAAVAGKYEIALAKIFGGAFSAVVRKSEGGPVAARPDDLRYAGGIRKGVVLGYPPALTRMLELTYDLVPDIQVAARAEIALHFPENEWTIGDDGAVRELALSAPTGSIRLRPANAAGRLIVLLRLYAAPLDAPFRIQLLAEGAEIAGIDVHQPDSFLLRGVLPDSGATAALSVALRAPDRTPLARIPPVRILALRIACVGSE